MNREVGTMGQWFDKEEPRSSFDPGQSHMVPVPSIGPAGDDEGFLCLALELVASSGIVGEDIELGHFDFEGDGGLGTPPHFFGQWGFDPAS